MAGFEDTLPAGGLSSSRLKVLVGIDAVWSCCSADLHHSAGLAAQDILVQLRQDEDEDTQLDALNQLTELLSISSEESLGILPVEQLIPVLVSSATVQRCCSTPALRT